MVTMPIGTYFLTLNSLYRGEQINRTFSAPNADIEPKAIQHLQELQQLSWLTWY